MTKDDYAGQRDAKKPERLWALSKLDTKEASTGTGVQKSLQF